MRKDGLTAPCKCVYLGWNLAFRITGYEKHLKGKLSAICQEAIENVLDQIDIAEGREAGELPPECFEIAEAILGYIINEFPYEEPERPKPQLTLLKGGKDKKTPVS